MRAKVILPPPVASCWGGNKEGYSVCGRYLVGSQRKSFTKSGLPIRVSSLSMSLASAMEKESEIRRTTHSSFCDRMKAIPHSIHQPTFLFLIFNFSFFLAAHQLTQM